MTRAFDVTGIMELTASACVARPEFMREITAMLKHVLVPLDGSLRSERAIEHATHTLAAGGTITLVTAVELPEIPLYGFDLVGVSTAPSYQASLEDVLQRARAYLEEIAGNLRGQGFGARYSVQFGEPSCVIVDSARELLVDAICMSTHGRSGVSRWLFGSVTNKVLAMAPCPVLVVRTDERDQVAEPCRETREEPEPTHEDAGT